MKIYPVDDYADLYQISDVISDELQKEIFNTDWFDLDFVAQQGQETWLRRRIKNENISWFHAFHHALQSHHSSIEAATGKKIDPYMDTIFWLDLPGFVCTMHTDGELPGSMQINWICEPCTGTVFYHSKNSNDVRYKTPAQPNHGYVMINHADQTGFRHLQWHGMLQPVSQIRVTSYTLLLPLK